MRRRGSTGKPMRDTIHIKSDKVFISYRRSDAEVHAKEIFRAITDFIPPEHVFLDQESIPPGVNFLEYLEAWVSKCDILIALIGHRWIDASDVDGTGRRLDNTEDLVRLELRKGLERGIPLVPVLIDGAPMPNTNQLPTELKGLVWQNAVRIAARTIDADVLELMTKLGIMDHQAREQYDSAVKGSPDSMIRLAEAYNSEGRYSEALLEMSDRAPLYPLMVKKWYDLAVESGGPRHWDSAGSAYFYGVGGLPHDWNKGLELLELAAREDKDYRHSLAFHLLRGDRAQQLRAVQILEDEAAKGCFFSTMLLAEEYSKGKDVPPNYLRAKYWARKAISAVNTHADGSRPEHIGEAEKIIQNCNRELKNRGIIGRISSWF